MISISCHCENTTLSFECLPEYVRDCDCPMCNRLGALWGDFMVRDVVIKSTVPTVTYQWDGGDYEMHHCPKCGCSTHYTSNASLGNAELGINLRLLDRKELEQIPVKS